jgi:hypothetical protein
MTPMIAGLLHNPDPATAKNLRRCVCLIIRPLLSKS